MRVLENERVTAPAVPGGDGIMVRGDDGETVVRRCVVEFSGVPLEDMDEAASFVQGAHARVVQCRFTGAGKLVLCGSGDTVLLYLLKSIHNWTNRFNANFLLHRGRFHFLRKESQSLPLHRLTPWNSRHCFLN